MLALITGGLVSRELFGKTSVFIVLMHARGLDYHDTPLTRTLRRIGVASVMDRQVETLPCTCDRVQIETTLGKEALYVTRHTVPGIKRIHGVLTREAIDRSYRI